MSPSSVLIGLASFDVTWVCVQPGIGSTSTDAIGVAVGSCTVSPTVSFSSSTGTRKVISWSLPPRTAPGAATVTCASAGAASSSERPRTARTPRTTVRRRDTDLLQCRVSVALVVVASNADVVTTRSMRQRPATGSDTDPS